MRNSVTVFTTLLFLLSIANNKSAAQHAFISINNGEKVPLTDLAVSDNVGDNNKMTYKANFSVLLMQGQNVNGLLSELQSGLGQFTNLTIGRVSSDNKLEEERRYNSPQIEELSLSKLDASSKAPVVVYVKIKAEEMILIQGRGETITSLALKSRSLISSNYQLKLGTLPTMRVSKISGLSVGNNDQAKNFTIEVSGKDAKDWYAWLQQQVNGVAKTEQGLLSLMTSDLKEILYNINLSEVKIISYSFEDSDISASAATVTPEPLKKVTIGLKSESSIIKPGSSNVDGSKPSGTVNNPPPVIDNSLSSKLVRFESLLQKGNRINIEQGPLAASAINDGAWSAQWLLKPVPGTIYFWIENKWKPTLRINNEQGALVASSINDGAWSAHWILKKNSNGAYWIENRWKTGQRLNIENGILESSIIGDGAISAMWEITIVQ